MVGNVANLLLSSETEIVPAINNTFWSTIGQWLLNLLSMLGNGIAHLAYYVCKFALNVIDFLQFLVQKLAGLDAWLNFSGDLGDLGNLQKTDVVFRFLLSDTVTTVFRAMLGIFLVLLILFSIIAIIKNEYGNATSGKDPVDHKKTLYSAFRAIIMVVLVPVLLVGGILTSNAILASIIKAFNIGSNLSIGSQIFVASSYDASSYRTYARDGVRKAVANQVSFEHPVFENGQITGKTTYYVSTSVKVPNPMSYSDSNPFTGYIFTFNGNDYFMWECNESEAEKYYLYLRFILGAYVVEPLQDRDAYSVYEPYYNEYYHTTAAQQSIIDKATNKYANLLLQTDGLNVTGDNFTLEHGITVWYAYKNGFFKYNLGHTSFTHDKENELIGIAYNTWNYNTALEDSIRLWAENDYTLEIEPRQVTLINGSTVSASVINNSKAWGRLHDGGINGFAPIAEEYYAMADVIDFMLQNNVELYFVKANNANLDYNVDGIGSDALYYTRSENNIIRQGLLVNYKNRGRVAYDISNTNANSELDGATYIICYYNSSLKKYEPLINNVTMKDARGNSYTFKSGTYADSYKGVVIARSMFQSSILANNVIPTYISQTLVTSTSTLGSNTTSTESTKDKLYSDVSTIGYRYNYTEQITDAKNADVVLKENVIAGDIDITNLGISYYSQISSNQTAADIANDISGKFIASAIKHTAEFEEDRGFALWDENSYYVDVYEAEDELNDTFEVGDSFKILLKDENDPNPSRPQMYVLSLTVSSVKDIYSSALSSLGQEERQADFRKYNFDIKLTRYGDLEGTSISLQSNTAVTADNQYYAATYNENNNYKLTFGAEESLEEPDITDEYFLVKYGAQISALARDLFSTSNGVNYFDIDDIKIETEDRDYEIVYKIVVAGTTNFETIDGVGKTGARYFTVTFTYTGKSTSDLTVYDDHGVEQTYTYNNLNFFANVDKLSNINANAVNGYKIEDYNSVIYRNTNSPIVGTAFVYGGKLYYVGSSQAFIATEGERGESSTNLRDEINSQVLTNYIFGESTIGSTITYSGEITRSTDDNGNVTGVSNYTANVLSTIKNSDNEFYNVKTILGYSSIKQLVAPASVDDYGLYLYAFNVNGATVEGKTYNNVNLTVYNTYYIYTYVQNVTLNKPDSALVDENGILADVVFSDDNRLSGKVDHTEYDDSDHPYVIQVDEPIVVTLENLTYEDTKTYDVYGYKDESNPELGLEIKSASIRQYSYRITENKVDRTYVFNAVVDKDFGSDGNINLFGFKKGEVEWKDISSAADETELVYRVSQVRVIDNANYIMMNKNDDKSVTYYVLDINSTVIDDHYKFTMYSFTVPSGEEAFDFDSGDVSKYTVDVSKDKFIQLETSDIIVGSNTEYVNVEAVASGSDSSERTYLRERFAFATYEVDSMGFNKYTKNIGTENTYTLGFTSNTNTTITLQINGIDDADAANYKSSRERAEYHENRAETRFTLVNHSGNNFYANVDIKNGNIVAKLLDILENPISVIFCRDNTSHQAFTADFYINMSWEGFLNLKFYFRLKITGSVYQENERFTAEEAGATYSKDSASVALTRGKLATDYNFSAADYSIDNVYQVANLQWIILVFAIVLIFSILGKAVWGLIKRIYQITLLFLIMPGVAATIPLDPDGRFGKWRNQIISEVLGAYGVTIGLNFLFIILPVLRDASQIFTQQDFDGLPTIIRGFAVNPDRLNGLVYILFLLVAFTLLNTAPKFIHDIIGGNDVVKSGEETQKAAVGNLKNVSDTVSGRSAVKSMEAAKTWAFGEKDKGVRKGGFLTPGKALGGQIKSDATAAKDWIKDKFGIQGKKSQEEIDQAENKRRANEELEERRAALEDRQAANDAENAVAAQKSNEADVAKEAQGLSEGAEKEIQDKNKEQIENQVKDEATQKSNEANAAAEQFARSAAESADIARGYADLAQMRTDINEGKIKDYVGEERRAAEEQAEAHKGRKGKALTGVENAEEALEEQTKLAAEGKGKKARITQSDIAAYNEANKNNENFIKMALKGEKGYNSKDQKALRAKLAQEKEISNRATELERRKDILNDAQEGIYRGVRGTLTRKLLAGRKTTEQRMRDAERLQAAGANKHAADIVAEAMNSEENKNKTVAELENNPALANKVKDVREKYINKEMSKQMLAATAAGKTLNSQDARQLAELKYNSLTEDKKREMLQKAVDSDKSSAQKAFAKAEAKAFDSRTGLLHFGVSKTGNAMRYVGAKGAALATFVGDQLSRSHRLANNIEKTSNSYDKAYNKWMTESEKSREKKKLVDEATQEVYKQSRVNATIANINGLLMDDKNFVNKSDYKSMTPAAKANLKKAIEDGIANGNLDGTSIAERFAANKGNMDKFLEGINGVIKQKGNKVAQQFGEGSRFIFNSNNEKEAAAIATRDAAQKAYETQKNIELKARDERDKAKSKFEKNTEKAANLRNKKSYKDELHEADSRLERKIVKATHKNNEEKVTKLQNKKNAVQAKELNKQLKADRKQAENTAKVKERQRINDLKKVDSKTADAIVSKAGDKYQNRRTSANAVISQVSKNLTKKQEQELIAKLKDKTENGKYSAANKAELKKIIEKIESGRDLTDQEKKRWKYYQRVSGEMKRITTANTAKKAEKNDHNVVSVNAAIGAESRLRRENRKLINDMKLSSIAAEKRIAIEVEKRLAAGMAKNAQEMNKIIHQEVTKELNKSMKASNRNMEEIRRLQKNLENLQTSNTKYKKQMKVLETSSKKLQKQVKDTKSKSALAEATKQNNNFGQR